MRSLSRLALTRCAPIYLTPFLALDAYTIEDAHLLDCRTGEPINSISGNRAHFVTTSFSATDVCDPDLLTQGTVTPSFGVNDGDTIKIQANKRIVNLTTTVLELSITAMDASANSGNGQAILLISD